MTTRKSIGNGASVLFFGICLLGASCGFQKQETLSQKPVNYVIILDLSDRLLAPHVAETDQLLILALFKSFSACVRQQVTIRSSDKFNVRIIPQKGSSLDAYYYENLLSIDMGRIDISLKNKALTSFDRALQDILAALYRDADQGPSSRNYFGCDIWKYFNEQLPADLEKGYFNYVIIMTDGYFDFENSSHAMRSGNRYTCSDFYSKLTGRAWKEGAVAMDYGLIPVDLHTPFSCYVCGLAPKTDHLTELEKLSHFWSLWMEESGSDSVFFVPLSSAEKMKSHLFLQLNVH